MGRKRQKKDNDKNDSVDSNLPSQSYLNKEIKGVMDAIEKMPTDAHNNPLFQIIVTLSNIVSMMQKTIENLTKTTILPLAESTPAKTPNQVPVNSEQNEISAEEKERRRSVVISGIPEPTGETANRRQHNRNAVYNILNEIEVDAEVTNVYRLGAPGMKSRLLKVILPSSAIQRQVLINARKLKESKTNKGVFIRPSLTADQRKKEYELRNEVKRIREGGGNARLIGIPGTENRRIFSNPTPSLNHNALNL